MESSLPVFSIGRAPKKNKYAKNIKKKVAKESKGIKSIKNKKTKTKTPTIVFTVKFNPYTGRRMFLPDAVADSKDIQTMFNQIINRVPELVFNTNRNDETFYHNLMYKHPETIPSDTKRHICTS